MMGYCGLPIPFTPREIDVDGMTDERGGVYIEFYGKATLQPDGTWRCFANVGGALCIVEVNVTEKAA